MIYANTILIVITACLALFTGPLYANYRRVRRRNHELRRNLKDYAEHEKALRDAQMAGIAETQRAFQAQNDQIVALNKWLRGHYTEGELAGHTWLEFVKSELGKGGVK